MSKFPNTTVMYLNHAEKYEIIGHLSGRLPIEH